MRIVYSHYTTCLKASFPRLSIFNSLTFRKVVSVLLYTIICKCSIAQWSGSGDIYYNSGNVGIGTASPSSQLHLASDNNHAFSISRANGTYGFRIFRDATAGNILFQIGKTANSWETKIKIGEGEGINTSLIFNPDGGNVGIGTTSPSEKLQVSGNLFVTNNLGIGRTLAIQGNAAYLDVYGPAAAVGNPHFMMTNGNNTQWEFRNDNSSNQMIVDYWNGSSRSTGIMSIDASGNLGVNTTNTQGYKFAVNGDAIFTKVKVKTYGSWPDYVFHHSYKLRPLKDLEAFIKENNHLPDVPSVTEIENNGLDVGENQASQLKKIEELTLYIIEQDKKMEELLQIKKDLEIIKANLKTKRL